MARKNKMRHIFAWILLIVGLLGVFVPHAFFLIDPLQNLNTVSHAVFEIASGVVIFIAFMLKKPK